MPSWYWMQGVIYTTISMPELWKLTKSHTWKHEHKLKYIQLQTTRIQVKKTQKNHKLGINHTFYSMFLEFCNMKVKTPKPHLGYKVSKHEKGWNPIHIELGSTHKPNPT